jgi:hypothetical protein
MTAIDVQSHEAGHALAAYYFGAEIKTVSVYSSDGEAGRCRLGRDGTDSELDVATILVAGRMAEKRALGHREVFNWFDEDVDTVNACDMVDAIVEDGGFEGDLFEARRWVELRARSLLVTKWKAVEAIAARLRKSTVLTGDEVVAICRREGVRRLGELSKDEAMARMTPAGKRAVMGTVAPDGKTIEKRSVLTAHTQFAEVERQIADLKAELDDDPGDDPSTWHLRRELVDLWRKHRELLDQIEGGKHR